MTDGSGGRRSGLRATLRRIAPVLGTVLLVVAVVPFVVFAVPGVVGADHSFVVLSGSMEPAISPGDIVIVDGTERVGVGDVVTFTDGGDVPTTHRVVGVEDGGFVTQGDANEEPDGRLVAPSDVLGRVVLTIPLAGHVVLWVGTPLGYVSLVVVPLVVLLGSELYSWVRNGEGSSDLPPDSGDERPDDSPAAADPTGRSAAPPAVAVATADLKLSALATAGLAGYAGWNVYREVTVAGTPDPVSVAALTGGLLGLLFTLWVTVGAWRRRRALSRPPANPETGEPPATTDGGTDTEAER